MPYRDAKSGEYISAEKAQARPSKSVKESVSQTRNFARLRANNRKTAAEELIVQMVFTLHSHSAFGGMSSQGILDRMHELVEDSAKRATDVS
jgi:hypothetical protein